MKRLQSLFRSLSDIRGRVGLAALLLSWFPAGLAVAQPNIVFILADDHRFDALSCLGHPFIKTPNIDRIAEDGVIFENFFVTSALCSPSRASFLTGAYPHNHEAVINDWCDPKLPMFPEMLQDLGYETGYIGKWHLARHNDPRPGFDHWFSFTGQGSYTKNTFNENGEKRIIERYVTDELNDRALGFIEQERDKPFALYLSHKAIHGPFTPAARHRDLYADAELVEPETWNDSMGDKPDEVRRIQTRGVETIGEREAKILWEAGEPVPRMEKGPVETEFRPRKWDSTQEVKRDYYRAIGAIDDGVGAIYELLEQRGVLDNTIIIYAGDNGFGAGEHRRYAGKRLGYEESLRVPFLMRYPGVLPPNTRVNEMCLNIDLAPTLIEAAGGHPADSIDGESFLKLAQGKEAPWRESFLYEYYREPWTQRYPTIVGVRTADWKYLTYPDSAPDAAITDELYDLQGDAMEAQNLSLSPEFSQQKQAMVEELDRLKQEFGYRAFAFDDVYEGAPRPEFWYEDNNMRRAGGYPPDFQEMWERPDSWKELRSKLDVYYIRGNTLKNILNDFGEDWVADHFAAVLIKEGIPVAVENIGTRGGYLSSAKTLQDMGVEIRSIALQSVLSKFEASPMEAEDQNAEIRRRIGVTVEQLKLAQQAFPDLPLGIIDALPPKGLPWRKFYPKFVAAAKAAGVPISFIQVDCPLSKLGKTVKDQDLHDLRHIIVDDLQLEYGFICTDNIGGMESDAAFRDSLLRLAEVFPRKAYPDAFIVMSWYHHPQFAVREDEGAIPMTRTALEFFEAIQ